MYEKANNLIGNVDFIVVVVLPR